MKEKLLLAYLVLGVAWVWFNANSRVFLLAWRSILANPWRWWMMPLVVAIGVVFWPLGPLGIVAFRIMKRLEK